MEDEDLVCVLIVGCLVLAYSMLFYIFDKEYRNNFAGGEHHGDHDEDQVDTVAVHWSKAKDQFNQIAIKFERIRVKFLGFSNIIVKVQFLWIFQSVGGEVQVLGEIGGANPCDITIEIPDNSAVDDEAFDNADDIISATPAAEIVVVEEAFEAKEEPLIQLEITEPEISMIYTAQ
jgi:hypothetical protein